MGAFNQVLNFYSPLGYLNLKENGEIIEINSAAAEVIGIDKTREGYNFLNFLIRDDISKFSDLLEQCKLDLRPLSDEFRLICQGGILSVYLTSVPFDQDKNVFFKIIFDPVKERKYFHKILSESEHRFRIMADNSPVMIWMTNAENQIEYMNKTKLEFLGKNISELTNDVWMNTRHPEDREKFLTALVEAARQKRNFSIETRVKDKEGNYRWLLDSAAPRILDDNTFAGFIGSGIDITDRKGAEQIINESEKRFRLMADNSPVMIWMTNADNELEYMNKTKLEFLGKNISELTNDNWMETRHPEDREKFLNAISEASKERKNFSIELRVKDKEGNYRWLLYSVAPRFHDDNSFAGFIGSAVDITDEKNIRTYMQKTLKEKEALLIEIHHRVKNNLQIISSLLSLQAAATDDGIINAMFQTSRDRIRSMAVLHEKLYQSESIDKVNLNEYLTDLLSYLLMSYRQSSDIELKLNIDDIEVDIGICLNIGLILNELTSNALKHAFKKSKKGEICVDVTETRQDTIRIIVQNDGVGIPQDFDIEKCKSVGLMLVKTLIDQHNGLMEISGDGRTFIIELQYQREKPIDELENQSVWNFTN